MATLPAQVRPGDLISSDLMNAILDRLSQISGGAVGTQVVPNVFGAFLGDARATILQPGRQLILGFTYDVTGAAVDPLSSANFNLIVLNQSPPGNTLVAPNTSVNLVVSQQLSSTGGGGTLPPTFARTETASGTPATSFPVNGTVAIVGTNFSTNASQNSVTFDGTPGPVASDPADPTRRLLVTVPTGIPGAPVNPGDPQKTGVVLSVRKLGSDPVTAPTPLTITAPVPNQPTIASVSPATQFEGLTATITGTNFTAAAQVRVRGTLATNSGTPTATSIVFTVPTFPDILPGPPVPVSLVVTIPTVGDVAFSGFRVRAPAS
ncbi:MAG TPA: IPT/TIG domain-containing protein [Vicinamibacterales bacterium]